MVTGDLQHPGEPANAHHIGRHDTYMGGNFNKSDTVQKSQ